MKTDNHKDGRCLIHGIAMRGRKSKSPSKEGKIYCPSCTKKRRHGKG